MLRVSIALMMILAGCGGVNEESKEQRETRQSLVFDISGRYIEDAASGVPSRLEFINEKGFHDIKAILEVPAGLSQADQEHLTESMTANLPDMPAADIQELLAKIELALLKIELGSGPTFADRGGENVPFDRVGDVSEIAMRKTINEVSGKTSTTYQLVFDFYLTAFRAAPKLSYESTTFTDKLGKSSSGNKGLILTIKRFNTVSGVQETKDVLSEVGLTVAPFLKFQ
jgi:hypothetical protein